MKSFGDVIVICEVISERELDVLRKECDAVYSSLTESQLASRSCAIDLFENAEISDKSLIRFMPHHYFEERWRYQCALNTEEKAVMKALLCHKLPCLLKSIVDVETVVLFNEHYVVKPPSSDLTFRWHTDNEEQLQCLSSHDILYYSMWCPLDDVSDRNGTLVIPEDCIPLDAVLVHGIHTGPSYIDLPKSNIATMEMNKGRAIVAKAGSVVMFPSNLMHSSGPNQTQHCRRVFYSQYSRSIISTDATQETKSPSPLCFAVECNVDADPHSSFSIDLKGIAASVVISTANNYGLSVSDSSDDDSGVVNIESDNTFFSDPHLATELIAVDPTTSTVKTSLTSKRRSNELASSHALKKSRMLDM